MVATDKYHPVVAVVHPLGVASDDVVVVPFVLEAKATVTSYNHKGVSQLVLYTDFIHELIEIPVNVT